MFRTLFIHSTRKLSNRPRLAFSWVRIFRARPLTARFITVNRQLLPLKIEWTRVICLQGDSLCVC